MNYRLASTAAALAVAAVNATACAHASPEPAPPGPVTISPPQVGSPCSERLDGALTALPKAAGDTRNAKNLLECTGGNWQPYVGPYPSSDRWLTTGAELALHGQGMRNPEIKGGRWTATPQTATAQCSAERIDVVSAGKTSAPETFSADPGQPLTLDVSDHLFTVKLSGYCLWQRG